MKKLLNTLFVTTEDAYLSLDGENVVVNREKQELARFPLHTLSGIIAFTYAGASPALMGACAKRDIALSFCTPRGRFLARCVGETTGNVLLRRMQYRAADDPFQSCRIARNMYSGSCTTPAGALSARSASTAFVLMLISFRRPSTGSKVFTPLSWKRSRWTRSAEKRAQVHRHILTCSTI